MERDSDPNYPKTRKEIIDWLGIKSGFLFHFIGIGWIFGPLFVVYIYKNTPFSFYTYLSMILMGLCGVLCLIWTFLSLKELIPLIKEISKLAKLSEQERNAKAKTLFSIQKEHWITNSIFPTILAWIGGIMGLIIFILENNSILG